MKTKNNGFSFDFNITQLFCKVKDCSCGGSMSFPQNKYKNILELDFENIEELEKLRDFINNYYDFIKDTLN